MLDRAMSERGERISYMCTAKDASEVYVSRRNESSPENVSVCVC